VTTPAYLSPLLPMSDSVTLNSIQGLRLSQFYQPDELSNMRFGRTWYHLSYSRMPSVGLLTSDLGPLLFEEDWKWLTPE
jgi:hypothetical protein